MRTGSISLPPWNVYITILYDNTPGELDIDVFGPNYEVRAQGYGTTGTITGGKRVEVDLDDVEVVRIAVVGRTGVTYSLQIDHPVKWMTTLPFGPSLNAAPVVADIDLDGRPEILIGTRPYLDGESNEIRQAGLVCLEDDGTIKWTKTFAAHESPDPVTGKMYTSSSICGRPTVGDINNDGKMEVIIGVGCDLGYTLPGTEDDVYSPGHKGGVYALDENGNELWSYFSLDWIGGPENEGDGLLDGVYSTPVICDVDLDGKPEVSWGSWDQRVYMVNGSDGTLKSGQ